MYFEMTSHFPPINRFRVRYLGCRMSAPGYNSALLHNVTNDNIISAWPKLVTAFQAESRLLIPPSVNNEALARRNASCGQWGHPSRAARLQSLATTVCQSSLTGSRIELSAVSGGVMRSADGHRL